MGTIIGVGNCQLQGMIQCAAAALGLAPAYLHPSDFEADPRRFLKLLPNAEMVFVQRTVWAKMIRKMLASSERPNLPVLEAPRLHFAGFHPDVATSEKSAGKSPNLPLGTVNSAILLQAWRDRLSEREAVSMFRDDVYRAIGYYDAYETASALMAEECALSGIDVRPMMERWLKAGTFFYVPLHPKIHVLCDIAFALLRKARIFNGDSADVNVDDPLNENVIWPVYPEIADRLGIEGDYVFRPKHWPSGRPGTAPMELTEFVARTFAGYAQAEPDFSVYPRLSDPRFATFGAFARTRPSYADALGDTAWLQAEAQEGLNVVCDEELLDDGAEDATEGNA